MHIIDLPYDVLLYIFGYLPSTSLLTFRALCKRLYAIPSGRRMTFVKAYEELWDSRLMKQPIVNIKTFPAEKLEKEVNRSWELERNWNRESPVPVRYRRLAKARDPLLVPPIQRDIMPHIVKGKYMFIWKDGYLHCFVYFRSGRLSRLERMWSSDELSIDKYSETFIRSTSYTEDGREISVVILNGYIFYFHLANGDDDFMTTRSSSPGPIALIRKYHLSPVKASPILDITTREIREEWVVFVSVSGALLHNCRTNVTWWPQCPDHREQQQPHWCRLSVENIFLMGERVVLCHWHLDETDLSGETLALYLIPPDSQSDQHHGNDAAFELESNKLIAAAFTALDDSVRSIFQSLSSYDVPGADEIEKCIREGIESTFTFHFVSLAEIEHRYVTCIAPVLLSVQSSILHLRPHVFRVYDEDDHRDLLLEVVPQGRSIGIEVVDYDYDFRKAHLYLRRIDNSKVQQFMEAIFESRLNDSSSSAEVRISHCGSARDLHPGLRKVWTKLRSGMKKLLQAHLDLESGRLFLTCSDGIRVFDYV